MQSVDRFQAQRAALTEVEGRKKLDRILEAEDPQGLVRSLPAEDLYFSIQEIGLHDAGPLVQLASPEQFRSFVDLDAWAGYELEPAKVLLWLRLARGDDDEAYFEKLRRLDVEVVELLIRGMIQIFDLEEEPEPQDDFAGAVERTPEGRFLLVYPEEGPQAAAARRFIYDLYTEDPFMAGRFLYAVRWELESELLETALRWRTARLADLGFPTPEEAAGLYAKVDLQAPLPPSAGLPDRPPGFFLATFAAGTLLDRALLLVGSERVEAVQLELVAVLNAALVADRVHPSEMDAVRQVGEAVRDTLSLGLEHLVGDDPEAAAQVLGGAAIRRIFQVGFTRTLELRWRVDSLRASVPLELERGALLPDSPWLERLEALLLPRPRFFTWSRTRPFANLGEVEETARALDEIEATGRALAAAGLGGAAAREMVVATQGAAGLATVRWSDLWLTAVARGLVGLERSFEALPADALGAAAAAGFHEDGTLREEAREAVLRLGGAPEAFLALAIGRLEEELGAQITAGGLGALEPRHAAPWIVSAS